MHVGMIASVGFVVLGIVGLYYGADFLVRGGSNLAARLGLPTLIIGLTLVAYGTSAPEFVVSLNAALNGKMDISIGNIVGSNICNVALILGLSAAICPLPVKDVLIRRDMPVMLAASVLFALVFFCFGGVPRCCGMLFFAGSVAYTVLGIKFAEKDESSSMNEMSEQHMGVLASLWFIIIGMAALVAGSKSFVYGAVEIARTLGVSEAVIGLTLVAVGTSLPELATSIVAALKKECDIAVGNVVGSNIFNILFIMGATGSITSFSGFNSKVGVVDIAVFLGTSFLLLPMMSTSKRITRGEGAVLLLIYVSYTAWLICNA